MDADFHLKLGMLCSCCDYRNYELPAVEGFTASQRQLVENLCKTCLEHFRPGGDAVVVTR